MIDPYELWLLSQILFLLLYYYYFIFFIGVSCFQNNWEVSIDESYDGLLKVLMIDLFLLPGW